MGRLLLGLIILVFASFNKAASQSPRPNIIYIMADDLGYADLSCYGSKNYHTPHLDKMALQGMKFTSAYAAAPVCTPTRVAFVTGRYPARTPIGLMEPLRDGQKDSLVGLTPDFPSIAILLKKAGYKTFLVGKWHLGYDSRYSPNKNGFDYFFGFHSGATDYISHDNQQNKPDLYENERPTKREGYSTDVWREKVEEVIKQKHNTPFFLSVQFNAPHWPWQAPGNSPYPDTMNWRTGGNKIIYAAMMKSLDEAVGKIIHAVHEAGLAPNTLIVFTSDNGGERFSDMGVYRGMKMQLWEGGIRVPAIAYWAGKIPPNSVNEQPIITMDWTATFLALAGARRNPKFPLDGIDLSRVLFHKKSNIERTFFWRLTQSKKENAVRQGNWKFLKNENGEYLFDLSSDPSETKDLKEMFPSRFIMLKKLYKNWESQVLKPVPLQ